MNWRISCARIVANRVVIRCKIDVIAVDKASAIKDALEALGWGWEIWPYKGEAAATEVLSCPS